jgi:transmembrane sensor
MSSGEAFFKVHHDPAKPFTVTTGELNVTAVGTAFDIKTDEAKVVVTVQEGVVSVAKTLAPESATWRVGRGDQIIYDRASGASSMAAVRVERFVSWQAGRLEYLGEPLGQVVADVSRYSSRPIEIGDPRLSQLTFTGTVLTGAINDWLEGVQTTFPIRVIVAQDGHYVLLNRSSQPTN